VGSWHIAYFNLFLTSSFIFFVFAVHKILEHVRMFFSDMHCPYFCICDMLQLGIARLGDHGDSHLSTVLSPSLFLPLQINRSTDGPKISDLICIDHATSCT
jgi:hypothetical protein